jgi:hypothetical protein
MREQEVRSVFLQRTKDERMLYSMKKGVDHLFSITPLLVINLVLARHAAGTHNNPGFAQGRTDIYQGR